MFLNVGGCFIRFLFCGFFTFFSLNVSAQNKPPEQINLTKSSSEILKFQPELEKKSYEIPQKVLEDSHAELNRETEISEIEAEISTEKKESLNIKQYKKLKFFDYNFDSIDEREKFPDFEENLFDPELFQPYPPSIESFERLKNSDSSDKSPGYIERGFRWGPAIRQSLIFLGIQHGYALTQPKTRESLRGNFFKDYARSVKALRGWDDGGRFFTNYIAHPMQGSLTGFIYVQNDPKAINQQFGKSGDYWRSRMIAMAWSAAWSTQFEIGPISQASIGNVGLQGKQTWEDIVITPTLGTAMLVAEDAADRFIMQSIERKTDNFYVKIFLRMLLSPTRLFANVLRFKTPWHRDRSYGYY